MRQHNIRNVPDARSLFKRILGAVTDVSAVTCCFVGSCGAKKFLKFLAASADSKKCRFSLCFCVFISYDTTHRNLPNRNKRTSRKTARRRCHKRSCAATLVTDEVSVNDGQLMNDGKHCPACGKDVGMASVMTALWPSRVKCPHCKARLTYLNSAALVVNLLAVWAGLGVIACYALQRWFSPHKPQFYFAIAALVVAAWLPVEFAATLYMRRFGKLEKLD